jgi:hypothetical protein
VKNKINEGKDKKRAINYEDQNWKQNKIKLNSKWWNKKKLMQRIKKIAIKIIRIKLDKKKSMK